MIGDSVQSSFLHAVKRQLPSAKSFVDELADILNISKDSAYRRIRGETILSLDEAKKLCDKTGVSIDSLFSTSSKVVPFIDNAAGGDITLEQWLQSIYDHVSRIDDITYAARDIPIFHYLRRPGLAAFKMFFWQKTVMSQPDLRKVNFEPSLISKEMTRLGERIWRRYAGIPSIEIWGAEAIQNTLKQIQFYADCDFFVSRDHITALCDELIELLAEVQAEASDARKTEGSTFHLYHNDVLMTDNTVCARSHETNMTYINYNTTGLLVTLHEGFSDKMRQYLHSLIKNSTLISGTAEKERIKFFLRMTRRLHEFRSTVN